MNVLKFDNNDEMPILGLGTFRSEPNKVYDAVKDAIKAGYRHIDCAAIYGNEKEVGQAIAESIKDGVVKRENLWITSKLWNDSHKKEDILPAITQTLKDLQLDYLDLYLVHWPVALKKGTQMPQEASDFIPLSQVPLSETWSGMEDIKSKGLARHIGVSNFNSNHLEEVMKEASQNPEVNQIELHPYLQQKDLVEFCKRNQVKVTAYAPLGSGGGADDATTPLEDEIINDIASNHQMTPAQVLIDWSIRRGVSVIPKSTNSDRIQQNFDTIKFSLSEEDMARIDPLDKNKRYIDGAIWEKENGPYTANGIWNY